MTYTIHLLIHHRGLKYITSDQSFEIHANLSIKKYTSATFRDRFRESRRRKERKRQNKAVYTATSVACGCARAVISFCKPQNSEIRDQQGRKHGYLSRVRLGRGSNEFLQASKQQNPRSKIDVMDGPTDRWTNIVS